MTYVHQVESLTAARKSAMQGQEPSDAIRVVNALLTQIDQIKRQVNLYLMEIWKPCDHAEVVSSLPWLKVSDSGWKRMRPSRVYLESMLSQ